MKRLTAIIILALLVVLPSAAVLKEKNLDNTLTILRGELTSYHQELERETQRMQWEQQQIRKELMDIMSRSAQNSLMLYSQKQGYIFDLTYACHEATEMYMQFQNQSAPFREYIEKNKSEIARYDSLITNLSNMPLMLMSDTAKIDRVVCLTLAINIRHTLHTNNEEISDYISYYERTEQRLKTLNDYAMERYAEIQSNIFVNGGDNYIDILKAFGESFKTMHDAVASKYTSHSNKVQSQWSVKSIAMLFAIIVLYGFLALVLNMLAIRYIMPKRLKTQTFRERKKYLVMVTTAVTLAVILGIVRLSASQQNFLVMASSLLIE